MLGFPIRTMTLAVLFSAAAVNVCSAQKTPSKPAPPTTARKRAADELEALRKVLKAERLAAKKRAEAWEAKAAASPDDPEAPHWQALSAREFMNAEEWKPAVTAWDALIAKYPESPRTPEARVHLFDVKLERLNDAAGAEQVLAQARDWAKSLPQPASPSKPAPTPAAAGGTPKTEPSTEVKAEVPLESRKPKAVATTVYDVHMRAMTLAWANADQKTTIDLFRSRYKTPPDPQDDSPLSHPLEFLPQFLENPDVSPTDGDENARRCLRLGNLYFDRMQYALAEALYSAALQAPSKPTPEQRSWSLWRRGHARWHQHGFGAAKDSYTDYLAAVKAFPKAKWAPAALLMAGNVDFNTDQNWPAAVKLYGRILKEYPDDDMVQTALYFSGQAYQQDKRWAEAKQMFEEVIKRYPKSNLVDFATRELRVVEGELKAAAAKKK